MNANHNPKDVSVADLGFRELTEALPILVWTCLPDGTCNYLSPQWMQYTGQSNTELTSEDPADALHPDDRDKSLSKWRDAVRTGEAYDDEFRLRRFDGVYRWFKSRGIPVRDESGAIYKWFGTCFDIEDLKQLQEDLRERDRKLREIFENLIVGCQILDQDLRYVYVNASAANHGRRPPEELIGRRMVDVYPGIERTHVFERIVHCLKTHSTERMDNEFEYPDGSVGIFELSLQSVPEGVLIVSADVTQERELASRLIQAQKMEAVGRLAGGVAHDFNNLLTVINGHCELLSVLSDTAQRESVQAIRGAGDRAARLTRQLLSFTRHTFVNCELLDLNDMLQRASDFIRSLLGERIQLEMKLAPRLGKVRIDPRQFEQTVMNLVLNARDAMREGGRLTITTSQVNVADADRQTIDAMRTGDYVKLSISDTGHGMSADVRSRIFEPFYTTKDVGMGTGLGLPVVYGAVQQAGGYISVASQPEVGSAFHLYYPCTLESPAMSQSDDLSSAEVVRTILLVEDEDSVRKIVRISLIKQGCEVIECSGPEEALAHIEDLPSVDLLVTDVVMPNMRGPELASALRNAQPNLRVLYMSGYADESIGLKDALRADDEFLQKPFSPMELLSRVRKMVGSI